MAEGALADTYMWLKREEYATDDATVKIYAAQAFRSEYAGKYRKSREKYFRIQRIIQDKRDKITNLTNIGIAYSLEKEFQKASNYFKQAFDLDNTNNIAKHNLMISYLSINNFISADKLAKELEKLNLNNPYILAGLAVYYEVVKKDVERSIFYNERSIEREFPGVGPYERLTYFYSEHKKDYKKVIDIYNKASIKNLGDGALLLNNTAYALIKANQPDEAKEFFEQILLEKEEPNIQATIKATRGLYNFYKDNLSKGIELYEEATKLADKQLSALVRQKYLLELGYYYFRKRNERESYKNWRLALEVTIDKRFFDYVKDINEAIDQLSYPIRESITDEPIIIKRYVFILLWLIPGVFVFLLSFLHWKSTGKTLFGINPFYYFYGIIAFMVWSLTCIINIMYHFIILKKARND